MSSVGKLQLPEVPVHPTYLNHDAAVSDAKYAETVKTEKQRNNI